MNNSNLVKKENGNNNKKSTVFPDSSTFHTPKYQKKFKEIINVKNFTINAYQFKKYLMINSGMSNLSEDSYQSRSQSQKHQKLISIINLKNNDNKRFSHNHLVKSILSFPSPKSKHHNCLLINNQTLPQRTKTDWKNNPSKTLLSNRISHNSEVLNQNSIKEIHSLLKRQILSEKRNLSCSLSKIHRNKMSEEYEVKLTSAKLQVPYLKLLHLSQKKRKVPKFHFY